MTSRHPALLLGLAGSLLMSGCGPGSETPDQAGAANNATLAEPAENLASADNATASPDAAVESANSIGANEAADDKAVDDAAETAEPAANAAKPAASEPAPKKNVEQVRAPAIPPASFAMCTVCHSTGSGDPHKIGPNLFAVAGAAAGRKPGYAYSDSLAGSGIVWSTGKLDQFLENPRAVVPGTKMVYPGLKDAAKRKEVVDYLATLK